MSVFVGKDTKLIVQGITGRQATFHTKIALEKYWARFPYSIR